MRATVELPDQLVRQAERYAADQGTCIDQVVATALEAMLASSSGPRAAAPGEPPEPIDGQGASDESWLAFRQALYGD